MKSIFLTILALLMTIPCIHAANTAQNGWVRGFSEGTEVASRSGRDLLVYFNGSDWCAPAVRFKTRVLESAQVRVALNGAFVFAEIDHPRAMDAAAREADKRANGALKLSVENYPHIILIDAEGRPYAEIPCRAEPAVPFFLNAIRQARTVKAARDAAWAEAAKLEGVDKAVALGKGLDTMTLRVAKVYDPVIKAIKEADPEDKSGYHAKYTFHGNTFMEKEVLQPLNAREYDKANGAIERMLENERLTLEQRLEVMAARVALLEKEEKPVEKIATLREIVALAPDSDMAAGARGYLDFLEKPVVLPGGRWDGSSCRNPGIWLVEADGVVTKPGRYVVTLRHTRGGDRQRVTAVSLVAGEQVLAEERQERRVGPDNATATYVLEVREVPSDGKIAARIETRCEGWWWSSNGIVTVRAESRDDGMN